MQKDALIAQLHERFSFASSTDVVGLLTSAATVSPFDSFMFMEAVVHGELQHGIELGLLTHLLFDPRFLDQLENLQHMIAGFHVQTGIADGEHLSSMLKLTVSNSMLVPLEEATLLADQLETPGLYINTHTPYIASLSDATLQELAWLQAEAKNWVISIEHHIHRRTDEKLRAQTARAQKNGLPTLTTVDLYHLMASDPSFKYLYNNEFGLLWKNIMYILEETGPCIVHIPVGTNLRDSIPILDLDKISDKMLIQLAEIMEANGCFPTIEYQCGFRHLLLTQTSSSRKQVERMRKIMKRLVAAGIVKVMQKVFYSLPTRAVALT
jgi:hypothetical protein